MKRLVTGLYEGQGVPPMSWQPPGGQARYCMALGTLLAIETRTADEQPRGVLHLTGCVP